MHEESGQGSGGRRGGEGHLRLLVVDEAEESRRRAADFFRAQGYEVSVTGSAVEALAQSLTRGVDVVIMSVTLPGLEGHEAAAILKRVSPGVQVILTAEPGAPACPGESQRTERFRCFPKPLDLEALARAIGEAGT